MTELQRVPPFVAGSRVHIWGDEADVDISGDSPAAMTGDEGTAVIQLGRRPMAPLTRTECRLPAVANWCFRPTAVRPIGEDRPFVETSERVKATLQIAGSPSVTQSLLCSDAEYPPMPALGLPAFSLWSPHIGLVGHSGVGRTARTHWLTGEAEATGRR